MTLSEPILEEKLVVFGKKSKFEGKAKWPDDFSGAKVGLNAGFDHAGLLGDAGAAAEKEGKIKIDEGPDSALNLKKLDMGRVDFYINDQLTDISSVAGGDDPVVIGAEVGGQWGYLGYTQKTDAFPFAKDFQEKFNAVIKEMKESGRIAEIVKSYQK